MAAASVGTEASIRRHLDLWHQQVGRALEVLLRNAGYSEKAQCRNVDFFRKYIAPSLGVFKVPSSEDESASAWQSFMTDDGTPVELSWDWGTTDTSQPTVRYSIEPIGLQAGSSLDPINSLAGLDLQESLQRALPDINLEWFDHFTKYFDNSREGQTKTVSASCIYTFYLSLKELLYDRKIRRSDQGFRDHSSSVFFSFDITETEITTKAYFFPKYRAIQRGQSNLETLLQGIQGAPGCADDNLHALSIFRDFAADPLNQHLEYEMVAIDLVHPSKSRFKIYFRSRETSFESLANNMTLGGRLVTSDMELGLAELHSLWIWVFRLGDCDTLAHNGHPTAGILYNVEFRLGDKNPVAKAYLPVRHYSRNDQLVMQGLEDYLTSRHRARHVPAFARAMNDLFGSELLEKHAGAQTYVGCTIRPKGALRIVSYLKPQLVEPTFDNL